MLRDEYVYPRDLACTQACIFPFEYLPGDGSAHSDCVTDPGGAQVCRVSGGSLQVSRCAHGGGKGGALGLKVRVIK